jgi:hypothetical protein
MARSGVRAFGCSSLALAVALACATPAPPVDLAAATRGRGPYDPAQRLETYRAIDAAAVAAIAAARRTARVVVATAELPDGGGRLELASFGERRRAEQFALYAPGQRDTQDFGYVFELGGAGRFDWLVFVGGPMRLTGSAIDWMDYHWIDTNGDGRVDVVVFNAVDLDGDRAPDPGVTGWLYDRDHDGLVDDAEYLGPFGARPVERRGDELVLTLWTGEKRISTKDPNVLGRLATLLQRINAAAPSRAP